MGAREGKGLVGVGRRAGDILETQGRRNLKEGCNFRSAEESSFRQGKQAGAGVHTGSEAAEKDKVSQTGCLLFFSIPNPQEGTKHQGLWEGAEAAFSCISVNLSPLRREGARERCSRDCKCVCLGEGGRRKVGGGGSVCSPQH